MGVLIYHLSAAYCPAGYFGVDLFFVISGFLLFRSLFKPGTAQNFHYGTYLLKKAWRILPSWFIVVVTACAIAAYLFPPERMGDILKTARSSALFHADYRIDASGDYFNTFTQQNPLLHFWYLSVTQQIYFIAPLLIIPLVRRHSRRAAALVLTCLAVLSLLYYALTSSHVLLPDTVRLPMLTCMGMKTAYYHLIPRFWELALGAAVFVLPELAGRPGWRSALGLTGLVGVLLSFWLYSTGSPSVYLTVVASVLALRYADSGVAASCLSWRPLQALGTISFSLYLWHWPVMVFWKYYCMDAPGVWDEVGMVILSLLLAALSWFCVERIRIPSRSGWRGTLVRCLLLLLIPVVVIAASKANKGIRKQAELRLGLPVTSAELSGLEKLPDYGMSQPLLRLGKPDVPFSFVLLGDSHAGHLSAQLHLACQRESLSGLYLNNSAAPYWNLIHPKVGADTCCWNKEIAESLLAYLKERPHIRYVLIAQHWSRRLQYDAVMDWNTGAELALGEERLRFTSKGLAELCDRLRAQGTGVILLGDTPCFDAPAPLDEWERCRRLKLEYKERIQTQQEHNRKQLVAHTLHRRLAEEGRAVYIDLAQAVAENGTYPARVNGEFLYSDTNHLSEAGARRVVDYLMSRLLELMPQQR